MAGGSGAAAASPKGDDDDAVVPAWEAGTKGLTPKGDGGKFPSPGMPPPLESAAFMGSNWASL